MRQDQRAHVNPRLLFQLDQADEDGGAHTELLKMTDDNTSAGAQIWKSWGWVEKD